MQAKVFSQKVNFLRENLECSFWMEEKVRLCIQTAFGRTLLSYLFTANANSLNHAKNKNLKMVCASKNR